MAENKAKRSFHLAQPERLRTKPEPGELMPVKVHAYRVLAELNAGFDKVIQDLTALQRISYLNSESLAAMHDLVCGIRAQANRECLGVLAEREAANAGHFDGLCMERGFVSFTSHANRLRQEDR